MTPIKFTKQNVKGYLFEHDFALSRQSLLKRGSLLVILDTHPSFHTICTRGTTVVTSCLLPWRLKSR